MAAAIPPRTMPGQGRLGDRSSAPLCAHGCPACPHPIIGPAIGGSTDTVINGKPALRVDDPGVHTACCGPNQWRAMGGSATVFINGKPAFRMGDPAQHCGGVGKLAEGSPDVDVGGATTIGMTRSDLAGWQAPPPPAPVADDAPPIAAQRAALTSAAARGMGLVRHDCETHPKAISVEAAG